MFEAKFRSNISGAIKSLGVNVVKNSLPFLQGVALMHIQETGKTFAGEGAREEHPKWAPFANQYTRKDGTVVPAWGGIRKVHGRGLVKGRLRDSSTSKAKRVTKDSKLLQNTGSLRNSVQILYSGPGKVQYGSLLKYAAAHQKGGEKNRPPKREFLFFTRSDEARVDGKLSKYLTECIVATQQNRSS